MQKLIKMRFNRPRELCLSCHERIVTTTVRKGHIAMEGGDCLSCHLPHSSKLHYLQSDSDPQLCLKCHLDDTRDLSKIHLISLSEIKRCLECHEPHVTEKPGLIRNIKHTPFTKGECRECHE